MYIQIHYRMRLPEVMIVAKSTSIVDPLPKSMRLAEKVRKPEGLKTNNSQIPKRSGLNLMYGGRLKSGLRLLYFSDMRI